MLAFTGSSPTKAMDYVEDSSAQDWVFPCIPAPAHFDLNGAQESKDMSTQPTKPRAPERDDPHRMFDTAISELQHTRPLRLSQQKIFPRPAVSSDQFAEKQALRDAARALARLWNVPSMPIR